MDGAGPTARLLVICCLLVPGLAVEVPAAAASAFPREVQERAYDLISARRHAEALELILPALRETPEDIVLLGQAALSFGTLDREGEGRAFVAALLDSAAHPALWLYARGVLSAYAGNRERGAARLERAAARMREQGERAALLVCLHDLGQQLVGLQRREEAIRVLDEARSLGAEGGLTHYRIAVLSLLANEHDRAGNTETANQLDQQALELAREHSSTLEARLCNNLAWSRQREGRFVEAKSLYLRAAELAARDGNDWQRMQRLSRAASVCIRLGEIAEAQAILDTCLALSDRHPDRPDQRADFLALRGRALRIEGDFQRALPVLDEALAIFDTIEAEVEHVLTTLQQKANVLTEMGRLREALSVHERSQVLAARLDPSAQAGVLNGMGNCYADLGDPIGALERYRAALDVAERFQLGARKPTYIANIASTYNKLGRYEEAIETFSEARDLFMANDDRVNSLHVQLDLARLHSRLGNLDQAEALLLDTRRGMEQGKIRNRLAGCRESIAQLHLLRGDRSGAEVEFRAALELAESAGSSGEALAIRLELIRLQREAGDHAGAEAEIDRALAKARDLGLLSTQSELLVEKARLTTALADLATAETTLVAAAALADRAHSPRGVYVAGLELGRTYRILGRPREAAASYRRAIAAAERMRFGAGAEAERWHVFARHADAHAELAQLLVAESRGPEDVSEAFSLVERSRARTLLDRLDEEGVDPALQVPREWIQARAENLSRSGYIHALLQKALARGGPGTDSLLAELRVLDEEYARIEGRIQLARITGMGSGNEPDSTPVASRLQATLDDGVALVEMSHQPDGSILVFHISRDRPVEAIVAPPTTSVAAETVLGLIRESSPRRFDLAAFASNAHALYRALVAPVVAAHRPRRLVVVPDGPLANLPLECLLTEQPSGTDLADLPYLFRTHEIVYTPSAASLLRLRETAGGGSPPIRPARRVLVMADPAYPKQEAAVERGLSLAEAARGGQRDYGFASLPFSSEEADRIAAAVGLGNADVRSGADASEDRFKAEAPGFKLIHIAAHSYIDETYPLLSAIVLALDDDSAEDGFLTVREIYPLHLEADLVVLSACRTAAGPFVRGEGVIALARPFLAAGARSVLVSSWPVNDRSTASFMGAFYRDLAGGASPATALRSAREAILTSGRRAWQIPYHWAPFVLIGEAI